MSNDLHDLIKSYILKYPDLNFCRLADKMLEDKATSMSHRTIRQYASKVSEILNSVDSSDESDFVDVPATPELLELDQTDIVVKRKPKILYLDIETARMIVGTWNIGYKLNIGPEQVIKDWFIYGWAAKWLGSSSSFSSFVTPEEAKARDDKRVMTNLWAVMEQADIIITHNGLKFDLPKIKVRFIMNGLPPLSSFRAIDTYKVASKEFAFASNALNYIAKAIANKEKMSTTYGLWIECEQGIPEALKYMESYCIGDIEVLEAVYIMLRPWMKSHPNLAVLTEGDAAICPNCGSEHLSVIDSIYTTQQNAFSEVRCDSCGAVNRTKDSLIGTAKRKAMLIPSAH